MRIFGFAGWSGSGKTTLLEQLIPRLTARAGRVSLIKHAHHHFDVDQPGKDSWRHRQAGAGEVVIASSRRLAKIRDFPGETRPTLHTLIAELADCDWALVEGFKRADIPKIEVWRAALGKPVQYPGDRFIVAVATDGAPLLPKPTTLPVLDLNQPDAVARFLLQSSARYDYFAPEAAVDAR